MERSTSTPPATVPRAERHRGLRDVQASSHGGSRMPANRPARSRAARPGGTSAASGLAATTDHLAPASATDSPPVAGAAPRTGDGPPADAGPRTDWRCTVSGTPALVAVVRRFVRAVLRDCPRAHDAELVVSELVTNAIRHTPSGAPGAVVRLRVTTGAGWARVEVGDLGDSAWHRPRLPGADEECGRGLAIICSLADRAGRDPAPDGQISWAEFGWDVPADRPGTGRSPSPHTT